MFLLYHCFFSFATRNIDNREAGRVFQFAETIRIICRVSNIGRLVLVTNCVFRPFSSERERAAAEREAGEGGRSAPSELEGRNSDYPLSVRLPASAPFPRSPSPLPIPFLRPRVSLFFHSFGNRARFDVQSVRRMFLHLTC